MEKYSIINALINNVQRRKKFRRIKENEY